MPGPESADGSASSFDRRPLDHQNNGRTDLIFFVLLLLLLSGSAKPVLE